MSVLTVRRAQEEDAPGVRRVIALALLAAGFPPPDAERDADLVDPAYYRAPGRGLWVAVDAAGDVEGCAAVDRASGDVAVLRRLAGRGLTDLARAALGFAQEEGYRLIETVLAPGLDQARDSLVALGFAEASEGNTLLYRRPL
jgi:GNAT superfamily N-acetyltransferase